MKRLVCCFLVVAILMSFTVVFANSGGLSAMEIALAKVKEKVDIPEDFTKFTPYTNEYRDGSVNYTFAWNPEEKSAGIEVSCDGKGRILRYYFYDSGLTSEKKISNLSKAEVVAFGDEFLKKIIPEAFANENDVLVFDVDSWDVDKSYYFLSYKRIRDGIEVKDHQVILNIHIVNDVPYVTSMNLYADYDGEFEAVPAELEGYEEKYNKAFPVEMIYKDDVQDYWRKIDVNEDVETVLLYRYKDNNAGYILSSTGEVVTEDSVVYGGAGGGSLNLKAEASADSAMCEELFTEQELAELDKIRELIPKDDIPKILEKLPYVGFDDTLQMNVYEIYRNGEKYTVRAGFTDEKKERNINATFDGKSGELLDFYNSAPYVNEDMTDAQKRVAETRIDEFLKVVAPDKLKEYSFDDTNVSQKRISRTYIRKVNNVEYISDSVFVTYDAATGRIINYYLDYADNRVFKATDTAISAEDAYKKLFEVSPLKRVYIKTDGIYKVCYTVETQGTEIDAFTGEEYRLYGKTEKELFEYNDIKGHWAETAITKLGEAQIGFEGDKFNPDVPVTQYDLLRFLGAGLRYNSYLTYTEDDIYEMMIDEGILAEDEKNPTASVNREDAFKYFVRMEGFEKVAKLNDIFKVQYADGELLTPEKTGYAAILTGMEVVCGNGGSLRPNEPITRAEAAMMVYKYLIK